MEAGRALSRLHEYQRQVTRILVDARQALGRDGAATKALAQARWELMRTLREYQLFKHVEIFDPLITNAQAHRAAAAFRLKARCDELSDAYNDHVRRWTLQAPVSAWPDYQRDALAMTDRIARHLELEAAEVGKLLAGGGRTRARE